MEYKIRWITYFGGILNISVDAIPPKMRLSNLLLEAGQ
jgi:hypothetical protein